MVSCPSRQVCSVFRWREANCFVGFLLSATSSRIFFILLFTFLLKRGVTFLRILDSTISRISHTVCLAKCGRSTECLICPAAVIIICVIDHFVSFVTLVPIFLWTTFTRLCQAGRHWTPFSFWDGIVYGISIKRRVIKLVVCIEVALPVCVSFTATKRSATW